MKSTLLQAQAGGGGERRVRRGCGAGPDRRGAGLWEKIPQTVVPPGDGALSWVPFL